MMVGIDDEVVVVVDGNTIRSSFDGCLEGRIARSCYGCGRWPHWKD